MYSLTDASGCYASMEKIHNPELRNRPVVVLTNNDGCICAICPIAKKLGIPKFEPYFKVRELLKKNNVAVKSSNYELYGNISKSMMNVIGRFSDDTYVYSIDEAFSHFKNYNSVISDWMEYGKQIRRAVWKEVRMPVGVGFGSTITLAKAANHASKKLPGATGVAVLDNDETIKHVLKQMPVRDVWGVGSKISAHLNELGIWSALDLANQSPKRMRKFFNVNIERTVQELNSVPCIEWNEVSTPKNEIFSTRAFGTSVTQKDELRSALIWHLDNVCRKCYAQSSLIKKIYFFASTSPVKEPFIKIGRFCELAVPTNNISQLASIVSATLNEIFVAGPSYYRCGFGAVELVTGRNIQLELFEQTGECKHIKAYHDINNRFGKESITIGSALSDKRWAMRRQYLSPCYTTRWSDIPTISC